MNSTALPRLIAIARQPATLIPFVEKVENNKPVITFVSDKKSNKLFNDEELFMSVKELHIYTKLHNWNSNKINALKLARRRIKNCVYSKKARLKRKSESERKSERKRKSEIQTVEALEAIEAIDLPDLIKIY